MIARREQTRKTDTLVLFQVPSFFCSRKIETMSSDKVEQEETPTVEEELEEAKRFFALKKWNEAADAYAQVLESL